MQDEQVQGFIEDTELTEDVTRSFEPVSWTASEFLDHQKDTKWFTTLAAVAVLAAIAVFVLTRDFFTPLAVLILSGLFGVAAVRKPRVLEYRIDESGVHIGRRSFMFEDFKSFSVAIEGPIESIVLAPSKRWSPLITVYFSPEDGQKIFDALSDFIPFEEHKNDAVDRLLHKIRF